VLKVPKSLELLVQLLTPPFTNAEKPHISFINALAYQKACKTQRAVLFQLQLSVLQEITGYAGQVGDNLSNLSRIPVNYH